VMCWGMVDVMWVGFVFLVVLDCDVSCCFLTCLFYVCVLKVY